MSPRHLIYSLLLVAGLTDGSLHAQSFVGGDGDGYASISLTGNPVPTLTGIAPTSGVQGQTFNVVFTGTNFVDTTNTSVSVGSGITVNSTQVNSSSQLTVNISISPSAATGTRSFTVTNTGLGGGTSGSQTFTVNTSSNPAPTLTSIAPTSGVLGQTMDVTFTGTNFVNNTVTTVTVGSGITANSLTVNNATQLTVNITISSAAVAGSRSFSVTNAGPGGGTSAARTFTINNPVPTLTSISLTNGVLGQTMDVVFTGTNFVNNTVTTVAVGSGIGLNSVTVNSATQLTANITISSSTVAGSRSFNVTNAVPGGGTSAAQTFTVNNPVPTLTDITPKSGGPGQTLDVIFTGSNFINGVSSVNSTADITVNSTSWNISTQLTVNITIKSSAAPGAHSFSVTNAPPGGGTSGSQTFTVNSTSNPAPTLTSIAPTNGVLGQTMDVVFAGTNFVNNTVTTVAVGSGIALNSVTVNSATQLTANITIGYSAAVGSRNFSVMNAGPGGGTSAAQTFTVNNPVPTLTDITPRSAGPGETLDVFFTGSNFINGVSSVNSTADITVNSTSWNSSTQLTVNITVKSSATTGAHSFSVTNAPPGGGTSGSQTFTVNSTSHPAPTLTSIGPTSAGKGETLDVLFTGTNFVDTIVTSVNVGPGIAVNSIKVVSSTQLTANITISVSATTGNRQFSVTNAGPGGGTSGSQTFTVNIGNNPGPTLVTITPKSGIIGQTLDVAFVGTNFINNSVTSVNVGSGITLNSTSVTGQTSLTINITIGVSAIAGARAFSIANAPPGGGASNSLTFMVNIPSTYVVRDSLFFAKKNELTDYDSLEYKLIGIPGNSGQSVADFLAGTPELDWQLYWDNGKKDTDKSNYYVKFDRTNSSFNCSTGRAFWLLNRGSWVLSSRTVPSAQLDSSGTVVVQLTPGRGFNLITSPFLHSIPWSSVAGLNGTKDSLRAWSGSGWVPASYLEPYVGYLFFNDSNRASLRIPYIPPAQKIQAKGSSQTDGWRIDVIATCGSYRDETTSFGVSQRARRGSDDYEQRKPRHFAAIPDVYFDHPEWDQEFNEFATDIRPGIEGLEQWPMKVRSAQRKEVDLVFAGVAEVPKILAVGLIDEAAGRYVDLRNDNRYRLQPASPVTLLTVVVGNPDQVKEKAEHVVPRGYALLQNYPNPFNPGTTIPVVMPTQSSIVLEVYNILGQRVATLYEGDITPGRYYFEWRGRNQNDVPLASGVYFTRLSVRNGVTLQGKMILSR